MKIELQRLQLRNFKGIRSLDVKLKKITDIFGDNATGKTTVFDGFLWLFFGKDSTDRKDFNIKTLGVDNEAIHELDHEVTGDILVNGKKVVIRRVYQEDWVNKKGTSTRQLAGHKQSFFWNDVPLKLEEFQQKVAAILPETLFKLITSVDYFNGLKWQDRRKTLEDLAGDITDQDVMAAAHSSIEPEKQRFWEMVLESLEEGKKIDEYQREIAAKKTKIKDELRLLPARIDEANRALPDEQDYPAIDQEIKDLSDQLVAIDDKLMSQSKAQKARQEEMAGKMRLIQEHKNRRQTIEFEERNKVTEKRHDREQKITEARFDLRTRESELSTYSRERARLVQQRPALEKQIAEGREAWKKIGAEQLEFKDGQFCCPTCKQDLPPGQIEQKKKDLAHNFNVEKSRRLDANIQTGKSRATELSGINIRITEIEQQEAAIQIEINGLRKNVTSLEEENAKLNSSDSLEIQRAIANSGEYKELGGKIERLEEEMNKEEPKDAGKEKLLARKREIDASLVEKRELASTKKQREAGQKRIDELGRQESELSATQADLEGIEFAIQQFTRAKMDLLEERVNGKFKIVRFKLFEKQINGGEAPCCETLVKGVPFSDINNAAKINAGLDIINTLCAHYGAYAPVFIDNAESVNSLLPVNSQLVRLVVSKDKKLKVESPAEELFETA